MSTKKIVSIETTNTTLVRTPARGGRVARSLAATAALCFTVVGAAPAGAQSTLGIPFIGDNHLSFYSTELTSDGLGDARSTLFGGRYAHRFGSAASATRFSLAGQFAGRNLESPAGGVLDASVTAAWTRTMAEVDERLSASLAVGAGALVWGTDTPDTGIAHLSWPILLGLSYDVRVGSATFTPFATPGVAYSSTRRYADDVRISTDDGWDARLTTGASLRLRELVITTSRIRGERDLPHTSRWAFSAGISF